MTDIRRRIFEVIRPDSGTTVLDYVFHATITILILVSVLIVFLSTFNLPPAVSDALTAIEEFASLVFTVEYFLRILTADFLYPEKGPVAARLRFIRSPMAIVDLLAILPFWLPMFLPCSLLALRFLRLARLLRILKFNRYLDAVRIIGDVLRSKRYELVGSFFFVTLLMLLSSLLMYVLEHDAQPTVFRNAFSGLWWSIATLTTVGYGDIYPVTALGRILASIIALTGIAALAIPTGIITAGLTERINRNSSTDDVEEELARQRLKDEEHDRLLNELGELVRKLSEKAGN